MPSSDYYILKYNKNIYFLQNKITFYNIFVYIMIMKFVYFFWYSSITIYYLYIIVYNIYYNKYFNK